MHNFVNLHLRNLFFFGCLADVDECTAGIAVCPRFRKCINTFGSYICKCHEGFDLQYINGKYQCIGTVARSLQRGFYI